MTSNHRLCRANRPLYRLFRPRNFCYNCAKRRKRRWLRCYRICRRRMSIETIPESPRIPPPRQRSKTPWSDMHRSITHLRQRIVPVQTNYMTRWWRMNLAAIHRKQRMNLHQTKRSRRWKHHHRQRPPIRRKLWKRNSECFEIIK